MPSPEQGLHLTGHCLRNRVQLFQKINLFCQAIGALHVCAGTCPVGVTQGTSLLICKNDNRNELSPSDLLCSVCKESEQSRVELSFAWAEFYSVFLTFRASSFSSRSQGLFDRRYRDIFIQDCL